MTLRLTIAESEGSKRSYSYLVDTEIPIGVFTDKEAPEELDNELESFAQGNDVPPFMWEPDGSLVYTVTEA